ncbi:MAG: sulfatase-like hydrolase/transferase, partial [Phycisphaerae bacterium]
MNPSRCLSTSFIGVAACAAACSLVPGGCDTSGNTPSTGPEQTNVLLICMDTVRSDRLGCYGYRPNPTSPHLDLLAAESTLFLDASATAGWTKPSVPSFMTGTYPAQHGVYEGSARGIGGKVTDVLPDSAVTLAEVFAENGYRTGAVIHNDHLRKGSGIEQGFDYYEDQADDARDIRWRALDWLAEEDGRQPFFLYLHFLDAHYPYPVPEAYASKFLEDSDPSVFHTAGWRRVRDAINHGERTLEPAELKALNGLYDGSIRYIDDQLGLLFEALSRRSILKNTVICVIADHGEEFMEHGRIGHGHGLYENLLRVPWILKVPNRPPRRVEATVSLVDLFPTLLAAAGFHEAVDTEGIERLSEPDLSRTIFAEHKEPNAYLQSYRQGSTKLLRRFVPPWRERESFSLADFLETDSRWEARLEILPDGTHHAKRLKPKPDEEARHAEIKGVVRALTKTGFNLAGYPVQIQTTTEFYGAVQDENLGIASLREGISIKAVGDFSEGVFEAQRVKVYPSEEEAKPTLRGRLRLAEGTIGDG